MTRTRRNEAPCWLVVADEAIAKVFEHSRGHTRLRDVEQFTDPDAHAREADFHRDAAGRRGAPGTAGGNATTSAGGDNQHLQAVAFAQRLADWLEAARQQQRFEQLRIVAAPRFLGALRKVLPKPLQQVVAAEWNKDLIHLDHAALRRHLEPLLEGEGAGAGPR